MRRVAPRPTGSARSCTRWHWATMVEPPPAACTPVRPGWPATSPCGCSARDDAMTGHRTPTSLLLAAAVGVVIAVLLGVGDPGPAAVTPEAPRSLRLPNGTVVRVHPVSTGRDGQLGVPDDPRSAGWWRGG